MRLIRSGPLAPALNLALDEALLRSGEDTLRLYGWDPPGLSLGFFQRAAEFDSVSGFEMVRRPTGGGAIAHTGELTIAWIGSRRRVEAAYAQMNSIVAGALARFGVEMSPGESDPEAAPRGFCFDPPHTCYDLLARGKKLFGSAQRRAGERFLLHGTLVLEPNPLSSGAISLRELVGREVAPREMEQALIAAAPWELVLAEPTAAEWENADCLVMERYANNAWTRRR